MSSRLFFPLSKLKVKNGAKVSKKVFEKSEVVFAIVKKEGLGQKKYLRRVVCTIDIIVRRGAEETFVSADIYCQNQNTRFRLHINIL